MSAGDVGAVEAGWIATRSGAIVETGHGEAWKAYARAGTGRVIDAEGAVVMPGFVDPHTHLCYAGHRWDEFVTRKSGAEYLAVLERGGGIHATVRATRDASDAQLLALLQRRLDEVARLGTTSIGTSLVARAMTRSSRSSASGSRP